MDYRRELQKIIQSEDELREDYVIAVAALALLEKMDDLHSGLSDIDLTMTMK